MFKALLKKQFSELGAAYFTNKKTGKSRSKSTAVVLIILMVILFGSLAAAFMGVSTMLADVFIPAGLNWLYFALLGLMAIALGVVGSVFTTYTGIYHAKDNEALLSMPIPPTMILSVRMISVYFMALLFSAVVWIPAMITYCLQTSLGVWLVYAILIMFLIALLVTVLSCVLGWVVALISGLLKNKSIITVLLTVVLLGAYYYFYAKINTYLQVLIENGEKIGAAIKTKIYPIYQLGRGATGETVPMLIFAGITLALFLLCMLILGRSFVKIVTSEKGGSKKAYKRADEKKSSVKQALLSKELRRFVSSPTYMLNGGLGLIILPILAVLALIKKDSVNGVLSALFEALPFAEELVPIVFAAAAALIVSMNAITAPSVSLEGKNIWVLQSLPVEARDVLRAKERMHVLLNLVPCVVSIALIGFVIGADVLTVISMIAAVCAFVWLTAAAGLALNLKKPLLDWTNEAVPVKQSVSVLIALFGGWLLAAAMGAGGFGLARFVPAYVYLLGCAVIFAAAALIIRKWNETKGAEIFSEL